jgi:hypothetical protein
MVGYAVQLHLCSFKRVLAWHVMIIMGNDQNRYTYLTGSGVLVILIEGIFALLTVTGPE